MTLSHPKVRQLTKVLQAFKGIDLVPRQIQRVEVNLQT